MPDAQHSAVDSLEAGLSAPARWPRLDRSLFRRRSVALILTILVHALLLLLVLFTRSPVVIRKEDNGLVTFSVMPDPEKKTAGDKSKSPEQKAAKSAAAPPAPKQAETPPPPAVPRPKEDKTPSFIQLSPSDFAAADLGKMNSQGRSGGGSNGTSGAVAGPGEGPGGVQLFEAEWYRRPTDAELSGYMPANAPSVGWGLVACKTIEQYHVENCQTLGESPLGSGFARAVRQAAWQFLVRPPRIDGKPQVGAWVRIRIDYTRRTIQEGAAGPGD